MVLHEEEDMELHEEVKDLLEEEDMVLLEEEVLHLLEEDMELLVEDRELLVEEDMVGFLALELENLLEEEHYFLDLCLDEAFLKNPYNLAWKEAHR